MKVLVACEESQTVCVELRKLGHESYSADIQEPSGGHPEWHILGDVLPLINGNCSFVTMDGINHEIAGKWDILIAFPPCTYLTVAGTRHFSPNCNSPDKIKERELERDKAVDFFMKFVNADCDKIAIENPVGYMNTHYRKSDQIIHPYFFAKNVEDKENYYLKRTCLWLKGLKPLEITCDLPKPDPIYIRQKGIGKGKRIGWVESLSVQGGQASRAKARSKTFPGIAAAMAHQFTEYEPLQLTLYDLS